MQKKIRNVLNVKKIFVAIFIYLVSINHIYSSEKDLSAFDYFKPLPEIDMFIGSSLTDSYYSLKKFLTLNCSILYGKSMDQHATINMGAPENDVLNYAMRNKVQFACQDVKYDLPDKDGKLRSEELLIIFVGCGGKVIEYDVKAHLDVSKFGKSPYILKHWINYVRHFSNIDPVIQNKEVEREFSGEKNIYKINRKYWSQDLVRDKDKFGWIFVDTSIEKNTKFEWSKGMNSIGFKSMYYPKITSRCF